MTPTSLSPPLFIPDNAKLHATLYSMLQKISSRTKKKPGRNTFSPPNSYTSYEGGIFELSQLPFLPISLPPFPQKSSAPHSRASLRVGSGEGRRGGRRRTFPHSFLQFSPPRPPAADRPFRRPFGFQGLLPRLSSPSSRNTGPGRWRRDVTALRAKASSVPPSTAAAATYAKAAGFVFSSCSLPPSLRMEPGCLLAG